MTSDGDRRERPMLVRILGAVEVSTAHGWVRAGPAKRGCVLAALAVSVGEPVSLTNLARHVWGTEVPSSVDNTLYGHIARLRALLRQCPQPIAIRTCGSDGYLLDVDPEHIDLHAARQLAARAGLHADAATAADCWRRACDMMRGRALTGIDGTWADQLRSVVDRERTAMLAELYRAELANARHEAVVTELVDHVAAHPTSERLVESLMIALYRCGRQTEALDHYTALRRRLRDDMGVEPRRQLRRLHRRILNHDPTLDPDSVPPAAPDSQAPAMLPAAPRLFTGRAAALSALDAAAGTNGPRVWIVNGSGGIGKTWLALHWGNRHRDMFTDGQLYVNLRGFDTADDPVTPESALRVLLHCLNVPPAAVPTSLDAMASRFRSLTADRKMLIVIDNARESSQVVPLLPGDTGCFTLVTARSELTALAASHGARNLRLPTLTDAEVRHSFADHIGIDRLAAEPAAAGELVDACAGLPLAVGIVAARAASRPDLPLSALAELLRDTTSRLDALDTGELSVSLRSVLDESVAAVSPAAARLFASMGVIPGHDATRYALASLAAQPPGLLTGPLDELERLGLVDQYRPHRYRMHDLTRLYVRERCRRDIDEAELAAAQRRLVDHYVQTTATARLLVQPAGRVRPVNPRVPGCVPHPLPGPEAARSWLESENGNIIDVQQAAAEAGDDAAVWRLAWSMLPFQYRRRDVQATLAMCRRADAAARRLGDASVGSFAQEAIGQALSGAGDRDTGLRHLNEAVRLAASVADTEAQATALLGISMVYGREPADYRAALSHSRRALALTHDTDAGRWLRSVASNSVGWEHAMLGEYEQARQHCEEALRLNRQVGADEPTVGLTLDSLGYIDFRSGRLAQAREQYRQAVAELRRTGFHQYWPRSMASLADVEDAMGFHTEAHRLRREAADLFEEQGFGEEAARLRRHPGTDRP